MNSGWNRRRIVQLSGASIVGFAGLCTVSTSRADADASVRLEDQETDGDTITVAHLATEVDSLLIIISDHQVDGANINYQTVELEAGTEMQHEQLDLAEPIAESQTIRIEIWEDDSYEEILARDNADVSVGEDSTAATEDQSVNESSITLIEENPAAGFHFPYFLYRPGEDVADTRPLVVRCSPWRGPVAEQDQRLESGHVDIDRGRGRIIAEALGVPAIVVLFPGGSNDGSYGNLDHKALQATDSPLARLDLQLLAIIDDARDRLAAEPYTVPETVHLDGFSANGEFFEQFTLLHPERVNAISSGGNGVATIPAAELDPEMPTVGDPPRETLPWPVGVADLLTLIDKEFNMDAWKSVRQFRYIGADDQWDPNEHDHPSEYRHAQTFASYGEERQQLILEIFGWAQVDERFAISKEMYDHVGVSAEFREYEGIAHEVPREILEDIVEFHHTVIADSFGPIEDMSTPDIPTESSTDDQPGLGLTQALGALCGLGYVLTQRMTDSG